MILNSNIPVDNDHGFDLLWTNEQQTSIFANDTLIKLDLSEYKTIYVVYRIFVNSTAYKYHIGVSVLINDTTLEQFMYKDCGMTRYVRRVRVTTDGIQFGYGRAFERFSSGSYNIGTGYAVPIFIFGHR